MQNFGEIRALLARQKTRFEVGDWLDLLLYLEEMSFPQQMELVPYIKGTLKDLPRPAWNIRGMMQTLVLPHVRQSSGLFNCAGGNLWAEHEAPRNIAKEDSLPLWLTNIPELHQGPGPRAWEYCVRFPEPDQDNIWVSFGLRVQEAQLLFRQPDLSNVVSQTHKAWTEWRPHTQSWGLPLSASHFKAVVLDSRWAKGSELLVCGGEPSLIVKGVPNVTFRIHETHVFGSPDNPRYRSLSSPTLKTALGAPVTLCKGATLDLTLEKYDPRVLQMYEDLLRSGREAFLTLDLRSLDPAQVQAHKHWLDKCLIQHSPRTSRPAFVKTIEVLS